MNIWGIGPILFIVGATTFLFSFLIGQRFGFFQYGLGGSSVGVSTAMALLAIGLIFYGNSVYLIVTRFRNGHLITNGIYRIVRNPMYSAFILFFIPGISLLLDNWLVLVTSAAIFIAFKLRIYREETFLEQEFGVEYIQYKKRVKQIIPFIL